MSDTATLSLSDVQRPLQRLVEFIDIVSPCVPEEIALARRYRDDAAYSAEFDSEVARAPRDADGIPVWPAKCIALKIDPMRPAFGP